MIAIRYKYADAESGYYQNGFRDYAPLLGRYLESDPIGLGGGLNTYGYVGQNPLKWQDQVGLYEGDYYCAKTGFDCGPRPPYLPINENEPGFVVRGTVCNGLCVSITVNEANIYLGGGVGRSGSSCSVVYTNNMQAYSGGATVQGGFKLGTVGGNGDAKGGGVQLSTPGLGATVIYSAPISTIFSNVPKPYPKSMW